MTILFLGAAPAAFAQSFEGAVDIGESLLTNKTIGTLPSQTGVGNDTYSLTNGFRFGFRMTVNFKSHLGGELGYAYNRTHLNLDGVDQGGMAIHQVWGDALVYATKDESRIRPFVAAGVGFANFVAPGASASYGQGENHYPFNYGGGVKFKLSGMWQLRFDIRQYNSSKPFGLPNNGGRLLLNEVSGGFGIAL